MAANRRDAGGGDEEREREGAGKTEMSAPVSTRKDVFEMESQREKVEEDTAPEGGGDGAVTASRQPRFPRACPQRTSEEDAVA